MPPSFPPLRGVHHVALITSNMQRAVRFYREILGLTLVRAERDPSDPDSRNYYLDLGEGTLLALFEYPDANGAVGGVGGMHHLSLRVNDTGAVAAARRQLVDRGVMVSEISEQAFMTSIYLRDPDGAMVEICAQTRPLTPADLLADPDPIETLKSRK